MKLDRLIFVNWGQLPPGSYDMGNLTLLTGETGSGKSTMLDGLQTAMTAFYKGITQYNSGQDETGQGGSRGKTRRDLESYIVGAEYSKFSRPEGAHGYVAVVFQPDKGEEQCKPFTAIVAASARVDGFGESRQARLESFALFIADGAELVLEDFLPDVEAGLVVPLERIGRQLRAKYPKVIEFHDKKMDYLCALYGRFRGKPSVPRDEAYQAAKAWVQSIAYRKIGSVHELVRDEILDFDSRQLQQDIERISSLMKEVANLRKEGARLQGNVKRLDALRDMLHQTAGAHEYHVVQEAFTVRLRLETEKADERRQQQRVTTNESDKRHRAALISERKSRKSSLDKDRTNLTARMLGIPAQQQKDEFEGRINAAAGNARRVLRELSGSLIAATFMDEKAQALLATAKVAGMDRVNRALEGVAEAYNRMNLQPLRDLSPRVFAMAAAEELTAKDLREIALAFHGESDTGLEALFVALAGPQDSLQFAVTQQSVLQESVRTEAEKRVRELQARKAILARGEVEYPKPVTFALRRLEEQFPAANPQVLCDLIEPKSEEWQPAIEGYIGNARFNIIVAPAWETRVLDYVREQNWRDVKVVQGRLCLADLARRSIPNDSIINELSAPNEIAWAFLVSQYSSVVKVELTAELQNTSRGLMRDGKASGSRSYFLADAREIVFGKKARERQMHAVERDLEEAERQASETRDAEAHLKQLQHELSGLKHAVFEADSLVDLADDMDAARRGLASLDLTELTDMQKRLTELEEEISNIDLQNTEDEKANAVADEEIKAAHKALDDLTTRRDAALKAVQVQTHRLGQLAHLNPAVSYTELNQQVEDKLRGALVSPTAAREEAIEGGKRPVMLLSHARDALSEFNQFCRSDEKFVDALPFPALHVLFDESYINVLTLASATEERLSGLRSTGLYNNQIELDTATKSFNDVFTKHFCVEIKSRVDDGIRTLRQMNNELRSLKFGQDSFSIDWSRWEPELHEYLEFFDAVTKLTESAESLDLFGENKLESKHVEIRDRLVKLLLDDDQERASKELFRIADYRNYRRYDILNNTESGGQVRLSEWGTGSGGQLETPAYIVRAAVVTNRLKMFDKGPSLKLLINDEAFSKMDEPRARAVLGFMRDNLNLQIISAMPTMKAGALKDEFNREYSFTRLKPAVNGELDFSIDCADNVFKSDKMRELWERQRLQARERAKQLFDFAEPPESGAVETRPAR